MQGLISTVCDDSHWDVLNRCLAEDNQRVSCAAYGIQEIASIGFRTRSDTHTRFNGSI